MAVYDDQNPGATPPVKKPEEGAAATQHKEEQAGASPSGTGSTPTKAEKQEQAQVESKTDTVKDKGSSSGEEPDSTWVNKVTKKKSRFGGSKSRAKTLLLSSGAGGGALFVLIVIVLGMIFLAQLKAVHYATVLRSTGFAASQFVMRNTFADIAYNNAVMTEDSLGSVSQAERTALDRLRRINPAKVMKMLGREGKFNIVVQNGKEVGFEINGQRYLKDEFAREAFPNRSGFKDLSPREKLTVKNQILNKVGNEMADVLAAEPRSFNNGFFKGFRQHFNIRTSKWAQKARALAGKTPEEARVETREQTFDEINDTEKPRSSIPEVDEAADTYEAEVKNSIKNNFDQRGKDYAKAAFDKAGVNDIAEFSDSAGKVSIAVMVTTMYCTARDIQGSLEAINTNKEEQGQRYAHDVQTTAQQIERSDVNLNASVAASSMWDGSKDIPAANVSPLYRESTGKSLAGVDSSALLEGSPTAKIAETPLKTIVEIGDTLFVNIPIPAFKDAVISQTCGAALNPVAQTTIAAADVIASVGAAIATGGTSEGIKVGLKAAAVTAVGIYGGNWLGEWLEETITTYAGGDFTGAETGIDRYNAAAIATDYQNAAVARGVTYGRPLTNEESVQTKTVALSDLKTRETNGSLHDRYFAIDNPYSLVGNLAAATPASVPALTSSLQTNIGSLGSRFSSLISGNWGLGTLMTATGISKKASAAPQVNVASENNFFGVDQWGWTPEELAKLTNTEEFDYVKNTAWVLERNPNGELDAKYNKCYTPAAQTDVPDGCGRDELGTDEALHWRVYKLHNSVIDQLADTTVTEDNEGGDSSNTGTIDANLPSGSKEELLEQIEQTGNITGGFGMLNTSAKRTLLAVILKLAQTYKFTINSVIRPGGGPHGNGSAVDVGNINGKGVPTAQDYAAYNEDANAFVRDGATLLPGKSWMGVSNDQFKKTANDIMIPKGGSSDLDLPSTTGATGAHFHLNVPADAE